MTWTVVVTNNGPLTATGVTITDEAAAVATFVSLQVSQGTCARTTCSLGTIPPGGSVRIVARTRMLTVGARLNTVTVRGEQPDSIPENNVASALIRIYSAFVPPLQQRCGGLSVDRRVTRAGATVPVNAGVRNVFGRPLAGTVVRARGGGQASSARTNARGIATFQLAPTTPGIVRFTVGARTLTAAGARRCTARVGVVGPGRCRARRDRLDLRQGRTSIGVPTGARRRSWTTSSFRIRTQPCETAWPISPGRLVPWMPTMPPPGQSLRRE